MAEPIISPELHKHIERVAICLEGIASATNVNDAEQHWGLLCDVHVKIMDQHIIDLEGRAATSRDPAQRARDALRTYLEDDVIRSSRIVGRLYLDLLKNIKPKGSVH